MCQEREELRPEGPVGNYATQKNRRWRADSGEGKDSFWDLLPFEHLWDIQVEIYSEHLVPVSGTQGENSVDDSKKCTMNHLHAEVICNMDIHRSLRNRLRVIMMKMLIHYRSIWKGSPRK